MTRKRPPISQPVTLEPVSVPVLFPAASQANVIGYLRQAKQAEAQMKSAEHQADLIIDATATALNIPAGWRLDMRSETWLFVPPEAVPEIPQNEAQ